MKSYATATAFRRALEDRLNAAAKAQGTDLQRIRTQVAFDRLLVRLFAPGNPQWRLKGGYALELKLELARATRDLDIGMPAGGLAGEELLEILQTAGAADAGDYFRYLIGEAVMDLEGAPYGGSRHPVEARLDGRPFARFHLDVGTGAALACQRWAAVLQRVLRNSVKRPRAPWSLTVELTKWGICFSGLPISGWAFKVEMKF